MQTVELQKCNIGNIPALRQVALQSYQEHYMYLWTEDRYAWWYMDISFSEQSLLQQMNEPGSVFYFILNNDDIVGFLKTNTNRSFDKTCSDKFMELERLYLLKSATSKGIGRKAVQIILEKAIENRTEIIWLRSMESSKSVQFYENIGFKIQDTHSLPYEGFKDEYRNIHLMMLDLRQH